jgi:molybdenum cofactor guanylyltransferase
MGRDKALLELAGKPLILRAVVKLRRVCMDVSVLGANGELDAYAPLVRDVHPDCGPMGGMEAALLHSPYEWNLFMPVDVPFLPTKFLDMWVRGLHRDSRRGTRVMMFEVDGLPQPALSLVHREVLPFLTAALEAGRYKLMPVLEEACEALSVRAGRLPGVGMWCLPYMGGLHSEGFTGPGAYWQNTTDAQERNERMWFANLNTPEDFAEAERFVDVLDT